MSTTERTAPPATRAVDPTEPPSPRWRGRLHQAAFFVSLPAGLVLVVAASTVEARIASAVYALGLIGLFGTSAAYHRFPWSPRGKRIMKRLDHSMIFVLIAATYTPIALLVVEGTWSIALLAVVWGGAALGIALKLVRIDGLHAVSGALYIVLGWLAVAAFPAMVRGLHPVALAFIVAGGLLYTTGAIVLALRRPDPNPRVFGYHEVWHTFTIAAGTCHYVATLILVVMAP
jgi:hemolysin III